MKIFLLVFIGIFSIVSPVSGKDSSPSFKIDVDNKQFLLDGDPFTYLAGEVHYFRIPHKKWNDRLQRIRAMGLNAITVPVPWNFHDLFGEGTPSFSGDFDLMKFIETAYTNGLYTIIRIGPFIGSEWDNGGLPWWLSRNPKFGKVRSNDPVFMQAVTDWFTHLLPKLYPLMRKNGGPIIIVQIEHSYGTLGICDQQYMMALANMARQHLGSDVVLITTDPPVVQFMRCGSLPGVLPTIEMAPTTGSVEEWFNLQQAFAKGPRVSSHFIIGSFRQWGVNRTINYSTDEIINTAKAAYALNASFSFHMAHGGSTYGYWNGAIGNHPVVTSYDLDAPIAEGGDTTIKYLAIRNWISKIPGWQYPPTPIPANLQRTAYPAVKLTVFDSISGFILGVTPICWKTQETPRTAEYIRHGYGYMYYNTSIIDCGSIYFPKFADNAYVFLNQVFIGALYKNFANIHNNTINVQGCLDSFNSLEIIVETTGRESSAYPDMSRGIQGDVYINNVTLENWFSCIVPIGTYEVTAKKNVENLISYKRKVEKIERATTLQPSVFIGNFHLKEPLVDTFLDTRGWGKGVVTINAYNIGRYWPDVGPQQSLFIPSEFLQRGDNLVMFYEFEGATTACTATSCTAKFSSTPIFSY